MAKQKNNNFPNTTSACPESTAVFSPLGRCAKNEINSYV